MYVKDEYTAKKLESACKKLSKKLKNRTYMTWQSVKDGNKLVVACDYYQEDDQRGFRPPPIDGFIVDEPHNILRLFLPSVYIDGGGCPHPFFTLHLSSSRDLLVIIHPSFQYSNILHSLELSFIDYDLWSGVLSLFPRPSLPSSLSPVYSYGAYATSPLFMRLISILREITLQHYEILHFNIMRYYTSNITRDYTSTL